MKVTAGERAIHISVSYDQAWALEVALYKFGGDLSKLGRMINKERTAGLEKGRPFPPFPTREKKS